jgi:hypothetical protein
LQISKQVLENYDTGIEIDNDSDIDDLVEDYLSYNTVYVETIPTAQAI